MPGNAPLPHENLSLRMDGWRWHDGATVLSFFAAVYGCTVDQIDPDPVRLTVPPGDGFYCFGNPWEPVVLYRWFGLRECMTTTVPPLALQRLWYREVGADDEPPMRFLYRSFLPRVQARLLRSSRHRDAALAWTADPHVTVDLTVSPETRCRMFGPWPRLRHGHGPPSRPSNWTDRRRADATSSLPSVPSGGNGPLPEASSGARCCRASGVAAYAIPCRTPHRGRRQYRRRRPQPKQTRRANAG